MWLQSVRLQLVKYYTGGQHNLTSSRVQVICVKQICSKGECALCHKHISAISPSNQLYCIHHHACHQVSHAQYLVTLLLKLGYLAMIFSLQLTDNAVSVRQLRNRQPNRLTLPMIVTGRGNLASPIVEILVNTMVSFLQRNVKYMRHKMHFPLEQIYMTEFNSMKIVPLVLSCQVASTKYEVLIVGRILPQLAYLIIYSSADLYCCQCRKLKN